MPSSTAAASPRLTVDGKPILFIDLEATGLSNLSYPIEIGWASLSADGRHLHTDAILIHPDIDWRENGEWSMDAQRLHGLSIKEILDRGADVMDVVPRFDAALAGCILTSDAPQEDSFWIERLYDAAGRRFQGRIQALRTIRMSLIAQRGVSPRLAFERLDFAAARDPIPHRAGPDAARMARLTGLMLGLGEVKDCNPE